MKKNILHGFLLLIAIVVFTACGTDQKENPPEPDGPYSFFDATTPLTITKPSVDVNGTTIGGDYNISVTLREFDLPKVGEEITMRPFPSAYGFLAESSVTTDANGRATFFYTAPSGSDFDAVRGQSFTIQAVYLDSTIVATTTTNPTAPVVLLEQEFELQFR